MARAGWVSLLALLAAGCGESTFDDGDAVDDAEWGLTRSQREGRRLFEEETFGGNGRTCLTCHGPGTGTLSPAEVRARLRRDPGDPLFRHDGSDDGLGNGVSRISARATLRMTIPLPPNVHLADDPAARAVTLLRGIPTTLDTPALDPVLMYDARAPDLQAQALGAIHDHAQNTVEPTAAQLALIAEHQQTGRFFSSPELRRFASGGAAPGLPRGNTPAERRGRRFFVDAPLRFSADGTRILDATGVCAICHSGPMLNELNEFNFFGAPAGTRVFTAFVSEFNVIGNPVREFVFTAPDGSTTSMITPDPGVALTTGQSTGPLSLFKIPTLRGTARTAPYFHDNSALDLREMMEHYRRYFAQPPIVVLTDRDVEDAIAYLRLL